MSIRTFFFDFWGLYFYMVFCTFSKFFFLLWFFLIRYFYMKYYSSYKNCIAYICASQHSSLSSSWESLWQTCRIPSGQLWRSGKLADHIGWGVFMGWLGVLIVNGWQMFSTRACHKAYKLEPKDADVLKWCSIITGSLADISCNKEKVELGHEFKVMFWSLLFPWILLLLCHQTF